MRKGRRATQELRAKYGSEQLVVARTYLKDPALKRTGPKLWLWPKAAWAVAPGNIWSEEDAVKVGKLIRRNLKGKRSLTASDYHLYALPLYVIWDGPTVVVTASDVAPKPRAKASKKPAGPKWRPGMVNGVGGPFKGELYGDTGWGIFDAKRPRNHWYVMHNLLGLSLGTVKGKPAARKMVEKIHAAAPAAGKAGSLEEIEDYRETILGAMGRRASIPTAGGQRNMRKSKNILCKIPVLGSRVCGKGRKARQSRPSWAGHEIDVVKRRNKWVLVDDYGDPICFEGFRTKRDAQKARGEVRFYLHESKTRGFDVTSAYGSSAVEEKSARGDGYRRRVMSGLTRKQAVALKNCLEEAAGIA